MTSTKFSPLHLEAPRLVADAALGEHLAALARASAPSAASRVRRSGWRVPLATIATIAASGSVAYAGQAALNSEIRQTAPVVPVNATITQVAASAADATAAAALAAVRSVGATNPHGKVVGPGHPKTGRRLGHPGKHDAGNHGANNPNKATPSTANYDISLWRKSAGPVGASAP